jgi:AcrR family transcriptional regulator
MKDDIIQGSQEESGAQLARDSDHDPDRGNKRERILQAALELFTERGFHGTAMPLVAERAGVAAGTIYRYFESKEALVNALFQKWKADFDAAAFGPDFPTQEPLRPQFGRVWRRAMQWALANPIAATFVQLHFHAPYLDGASRAMVDRSFERGAAFFRLGNQQQITRPIPPEALMFILDGIFNAMVRANRSGMITVDESLMEATEEIAWAAIRR